MRKLPPFCPLRANDKYDVEQCPRHKELQEKRLEYGECQCGHCIEEELDSNVR